MINKLADLTWTCAVLEFFSFGVLYGCYGTGYEEIFAFFVIGFFALTIGFSIKWRMEWKKNQKKD